MDLAKVGDIFKRKEGDIWSAKGVKAEDLFSTTSCHKQGTRPSLEDRLALALAPLSTPYSLFVGIYDGHGGERCAEFVSAAVPRLLSANPFVNADPLVAVGDAHLQADSEWMRFAEQNATRAGPLEDGSTGTSVLLFRNRLYIAHTGDSRAFLCSNNTLYELTKDHRPDDPKELSRITSHGGSVVGGRVAGKLGVSRSFGDYTFKRNGVLVVDPDVSSVSLNGDAEFLVVACDGLFEVFQPQQVLEFIQAKLKHGFSKTIAEDLANEALDLGSKDNVSLAIVVFEPKLKKVLASADKEEKKRDRKDRKLDSPSTTVHSLAQTTDSAPFRSSSPIADPIPKRRSHYDRDRSRDSSDDEIGGSRVSSTPNIASPSARKPPPRPKASAPTDIPIVRTTAPSDFPPAKGMRSSKSMDDVPSSPQPVSKSDAKYTSTSPHT